MEENELFTDIIKLKKLLKNKLFKFDLICGLNKDKC